MQQIIQRGETLKDYGDGTKDYKKYGKKDDDKDDKNDDKKGEDLVSLI